MRLSHGQSIFPMRIIYQKKSGGPTKNHRSPHNLINIVSCIANKVKFNWSGLDGELFRNLTCIPSVCVLISGRLYAKRDQPYKAMVFRRPTTTKYNADVQHLLSYLAVLVHPEYNRQITPYLRYMTLTRRKRGFILWQSN